MARVRREEPQPAGERPPWPAAQRKVPRALREPVMLEMSGRVFAEHGFHAASMDEIADAAGVSKPMLYSYFGSKEGLYFAYVDHSYRELIAAIDAAVAAAEDSAEARLRAGALAYYVYVGNHRDAFAVLFREMGDPGGKLAPQRRRLMRRTAAAIEEILGTGAGAPPPEGSEPLAEAFLGAARALANWWLDHPEVSAQALTDRLMDLTLVGLRGLLAGRARAES